MARSKDYAHEQSIEIDFTTPVEKINLLQERIIAWLKADTEVRSSLFPLIYLRLLGIMQMPCSG